MDENLPPVLDYLRALDVVPLKPPPDWWAEQPRLAALLTIISGLVGGAANTGEYGFSEIFALPVLGGAIWYTVARLRERKRTATLWRVQMGLATGVCIAGACGVAVSRCSFREMLQYPETREPLFVIAWGIGWFVVAEVGALVQRSWHRTRPSSEGS